MAFNPLAGYQASVKVGATPYAFDRWRIAIKNRLGEVSNFTGSGFEQWIGGLTGAKVTLEGPYDQGNMPFATGTTYALILGYSSGASLTVSAICETIEPDVKASDPERVSITFQSTGSFSASIS